jgi:hypothetical protein
MPKKTSDGALTIDHQTHGEATPPLLSEKRIAQLQAAVGAAQRRRIPPRRFVMDRKGESRSNR